MPRYRPVDSRVDLPALEVTILEFWRERRIFERSLDLRRGAPEWVFYEGPPTANGKPGIHHVEARTFKDLYPRFKTMTGHFVNRKAGWDCHGLPVELQIEKEIGTKNKRDIEAFGIAEFNRLCRESVTRYVEDWERLTERIGFWINMDEAYWTMDPGYIQSVWWALKRLHEQGLLFKDEKVTAYCPRCGTALSDHEVAQGYAQAEDPSIYVRFPVLTGPLADEGADLLVWTTMPWTLVPATLAVVSPDLPYVLARGGHAGERPVVLASSRMEVVLGSDAAIVREVPLDELVSARYRGPFDFVGPGSPDEPEKDPASWRFVVTGDFVRSDEGTGIVHTGAAYGEDDLRIAREHGVPVVKPVDAEGRFDVRIGPYAGMYVRDADARIIEDLRRAGVLLRSGIHSHSFPFCWRCDTPLIYMARPAWYIRTTARKQALLEANETVNWYPEYIQGGRYGDWLANNVDWSLSRERYWGTPLPVWTCPRDHVTVVGSLAELSDLAGRDVTEVDPHRPAIDEVSIPCPECGEQGRRVLDLIDVWFDSGAMPFAQWGYLGPASAAGEVFRARFPADFIAEAIDQTRGWFYTLMAEGVLLFGESAYRNVVCLGLLLGKDGRRMSTRLGTAVDPWSVIDRYGADALRWFLVAGGSPWSDRRVSMEAIEDVVRRFLLTLWNTYAFFVAYASIDEPDVASAPPPAERQPLDRWALSRLHGTAAVVRSALEAYDATGAARRLAAFVDDLSNWYVRRSRRRFWDPARAASGGGADGADKAAAYATLGECLETVAGLLAPFTPFVAEELYLNLVARQDPGAPESVHLTDFPAAESTLIDPGLDEAMEAARTIVSLGRTVRADAKVRVRQPLPRAVVGMAAVPSGLESLLPLVADELNVKEVAFEERGEEMTSWRARPNFRALGPRLGPRVQLLASALAGDDGSVARRLAEGREVTIPLEDGDVIVSPQDVELAQTTRPGWGFASEGSITVALDLEPGERLRGEGMAREIVHQVQNLRKSAGLAVTDRIVLGIEVQEAEGRAAVAEHVQHLAQEVLASKVLDESVQDALGESKVQVEGALFSVSLRRA
ncbi:MAG: isoleucine--tRNA ligase [Actinobacteria bacterium]|nr:isoleucine--tRNA ligase [Actinomycetota bacterium]